MQKLLSTPSAYAVRLLAALAKEEQARPANYLAEKLDLPAHYVSKLLQQLKTKKIVRSTLGSSGGYMLRRKLGDSSISEILQIIESGPLVTECLLGLEECPEEGSCALCEPWAAIRGDIDALLGKTHLQDLNIPLKNES